MRIRAATNDDAAAIPECLHEAFAPYRQLYTPAGFHDTTLDERTVMERLKAMNVLVATEGEIIGSIGWSCGDAGEVAEAESQARAAGCVRMTLETTEPLQRAMRFYQKNGYRRTGLVSDFFGMPLFQYVKHL